ncbi:hypothetical protein BDN71DRAFT_1428368 [Pleurotus eryngii]|uniref:Uncharacterized protein n=1 Tax=Pleurotus eryngii TaxID=5323 RepID=A0A9P6A776_PLEER|nr:hypothetical protein BDN71DRAFT_1428368 [Pleurotus eryngii]
MGIRAKIEQSNPMKPPTMGEGNVDAAIIWDWINRCGLFFHHKNTPAENRVVSVAWGMSGVHTVHWLSANSPILESMSWNTYKSQLRTLFLPSDWEHSTRMDVLWLQQGSRLFVEYSLDVMGKNNLLAGTDSFFNDEFLRDTLEANMDRELARECNCENTNTIVSFRDWLDEVKRLDEKKHQRMEEIECTLAKINACMVANRSQGRPPLQPHNGMTSSMNDQTTLRLPKLEDSECQLLSANGGCFKC